MITKEELKRINLNSELHLYQQEKEYFLKLFLYYYYVKFEDAVFKGGTSIKFCYGLNRFSEDLDFNIDISPQEFEKQVKQTLKELRGIGIQTKLAKQETFDHAFTCEIHFYGPLYDGSEQTRNKIRIDAELRLKTLNEPTWKLVSSKYPEINSPFLVKTMDEQEILAEKIIALHTRKKGRDLYDTWFLLQKGIEINEALLFKKRNGQKLNRSNCITKEDYERDMTYLVKRVIPFKQIISDLTHSLDSLTIFESGVR